MQRESGKGHNLLRIKQKERRLLRYGLLLPCCLPIMLAGCNNTTAPTVKATSKGAFSGLSVQVACPNKTCASVLERYGRLWEARSGGHVVVQPYDSTTDQIPAADLWIVDAASLPSLVVDQKLRPVPEALTQAANPYNWNGLLPLFRSKLLLWNDIPYALPFLDEPWLCFFRTDLLADSAHQSEYKKQTGQTLVAPSTWEDLLAIARFFHDKPRPGLSGNWPSLPPLPAADVDLDHEFYLLAVPYARRGIREDDHSTEGAAEQFSFHYDLETMKPRINGPGFVAALNAMKDLQKLRPLGTNPEPATSFERGEAVVCLAPPSWIARFEKSPLIAGKFGIGPPPGTKRRIDPRSGQPVEVPGGNLVPYQGASTYLSVVPSMSQAQEAAWDLAALLSDPQTSRDVVIEPSWGGGAYRAEHLENRAGWQSFGLSSAWTGALVQSIREIEAYPPVKNPVLRLRIPAEAGHRKALHAELESVLLRGKPADRGLNDAAEQWRQLDQGKDPREFLRNYRLSLGLNGGE
jgi:ABC-type glycerol-3-phosphate transport system substrate-binding protein